MTADDPEKRLGRLTAMQAKFHARQAELDLAPEEDRAPRAPILQKMLEHLSGDDGEIDPRKTRMFLNYVRKQIADTEAPRHDLAKRLVVKLQKIPAAQRRRVLSSAGIDDDLSFDLFEGPGGRAGGRAEAALAGRKPGPARGMGRGTNARQPDSSSENWFEDLIDKL